MRVSHSAAGRHRAPAPERSKFPWVVTVTVVGGTILAIGGVTLLWPDAAPPQGQANPAPTLTSAGPTPSQTEAATTVESSRDVSIDGTTVTVDEVSDLVDGASAVAVPTQGAPLGLRLIDSAVISADGRKAAFDAPITLTASGSLAVRNRYRLTHCPDILPVQWPSPTEFPDSTRTYPRIDAPLHTAFALCPKAASRAKQLPQLSGVSVESVTPTVRLTWKGTDELTIRAIGSASGVAALATDPQCDPGCMTRIAGNGSALLQFQAVDPCPPAATNDSLVLVLTAPGGTISLVSVRVSDLHRTVCAPVSP